MKNIIIPIVLIICSLIYCNKKPSDKNENINEFYVSSFNGLVLREKPNINSSKILLLDYHEKVNILEFSNNQDTINNIKSNWAFIKTEKYKGWAFAGYLKKELPVEQSKVKEFHENPFEKKKIEIISNKSIKDLVISQFGEPKNLKVNNVKNKHDPSTIDKIYNLDYDGLIFEIYHVSYDNKQILQCIQINNNNEALKYNIRIGIKINDLVDILGYPSEINNNKARYYPSDYPMTFIDFNMVNNEIISISILSIAD